MISTVRFEFPASAEIVSTLKGDLKREINAGEKEIINILAGHFDQKQFNEGHVLVIIKLTIWEWTLEWEKRLDKKIPLKQLKKIEEVLITRLSKCARRVDV